MPRHIEKPLSESLENGDGFVAPRYRSGQRSADALLEAGRALLEEISYEALNINELCSRADLTKGAFYRRFESKDAFFLALQRLALDDATQVHDRSTAEIEQRSGSTIKLADCLRLVIDDMRAWHLKHRGVIRASLQRRDHTSDGWQPFKAYARGFVAEIATYLAHLPELRERKEALAQLKNGFQTVIATMINAALNDPGPLHLADAAMTDMLTRMLTLYLTAPDSEAAT